MNSSAALCPKYMLGTPLSAEGYSKLCQVSKLGLFVEVVRDFAKSSVLDVLQIIQN